MSFLFRQVPLFKILVFGIALVVFGKPLAGTSLAFRDSKEPVDELLVKRLLKTRNENDYSDDQSIEWCGVVQMPPFPFPFRVSSAVKLSNVHRYFFASLSKSLYQIDSCLTANFLFSNHYYTVRLGKLLI